MEIIKFIWTLSNNMKSEIYENFFIFYYNL